jgi:hypothetical protein
MNIDCNTIGRHHEDFRPCERGGASVADAERVLALEVRGVRGVRVGSGDGREGGGRQRPGLRHLH